MRQLRKNWPRNLCLLCWLALAAVLAGCGTHSPSTPGGRSPAATNADFPLRIGDKIQVVLTGIPDLSQSIPLDIEGDGSISLPFIGRVPAAGRTQMELETNIVSRYVPAWYKHISVTVTPVARFIYVGGQVNNQAGGGRVMYTGPTTVTQAIVAAGDFNSFANKRKVQITRVNGTIEYVNCIRAAKDPKLDLPVYPGDSILVKMRRF